MENQYKEVYFTYCNTCKHRNIDQSDDPCHDCLNHAVNLFSHKPVNYEEDTAIVKKDREE